MKYLLDKVRINIAAGLSILLYVVMPRNHVGLGLARDICNWLVDDYHLITYNRKD
jgi:hypothetical protein